MEFNNVTVVKKANVYFEGKVTSRTVLFENGEKTLGLMMAGEYEFNTEASENMAILGGEMYQLCYQERQNILYIRKDKIMMYQQILVLRWSLRST